MGVDAAHKVVREALAHAERHGFTFPSEVGFRVLVTERGIASLRVDNAELAALTVLLSVPGEVNMSEESARLSDFSGRDPDAQLLDWVEDALVLAKRTLG